MGYQEEKKTFQDWLFDKTGLTFWCTGYEILKWNNFNWHIFNFLQIAFEYDKICGQAHITIDILGFGMRWTVAIEQIENTQAGEMMKEHISHTKSTEQTTALKVLDELLKTYYAATRDDRESEGLTMERKIYEMKDRYEKMKLTFDKEELE